MTTSLIDYKDGAFLALTDGHQLGGIFIYADGTEFDNYLGRDSMTWAYRIMDSHGVEVGSDNDLRTRVSHDAPRAMKSLVSFLLACADSKTEESENYNLFRPVVREWAEYWSDELQMFYIEEES